MFGAWLRLGDAHAGEGKGKQVWDAEEGNHGGKRQTLQSAAFLALFLLGPQSILMGQGGAPLPKGLRLASAHRKHAFSTRNPRSSMPKLAVFPKAFMQALCKDGSMTLSQWIALAAPLKVDGLEWYAGFLEMAEQANWAPLRRQVEDLGMVIPMMCCSPDFTHPDAAFRAKQVQQQLRFLDMTHALGGSYCRVLSGQRRPELSEDEGVRLAAECIEQCLPEARARGITLILENHYKDDFWQYPEFAQKMAVFCKLVNAVNDPNFGVNYDPSNTYLAGEDPLELLRLVSHRVVTMHASDRYLAEGSLEDLRREEGGAAGYAKRLRHGEIGKGLNDYDAIFGELKSKGFNGWISVEDGVDGMDQLERSVAFLKAKIACHWPQ
jgi:sugar phosphate isomerase/epimerase